MSQQVGAHEVGRPSSRAAGAGAVSAVTLLGKLVGLGRTAVAARVLGATFLADAYNAANAVPNVVYEVVAGGALATLVVPVVAPAVVSGDREQVSATASALLTWVLLLLAPGSLLCLALARPVMVGLLGASDPGAVDTGVRLLLLFVPQVVLYGVGVVLAGLLQSHGRFLGPALAPLLSSLVVIAAYLAFGHLAAGSEIGSVTRSDELVLGLGTTAGVVALSLSLVLPVRRLGLRIRPRTAFPPGVAAQARSLAAAGLLALAAQQVALVVALRLAAGTRGGVVVLGLATTLFLLPWQVLAVPVATTAFPVLSAHHAQGAVREYAGTLATSVRAVLVLSLPAAVVLGLVAEPAARLLLAQAPGAAGAAAQLSTAVACFAPGLVAYSVLALLSRGLYAQHRSRAAGRVLALGWLAVAVLDVVLVAAWPDHRLAMLGVGSSLGLTAAAAVALVLARPVLPRPVRVSACAAAVPPAVACGLVGELGWLVVRGLGTGLGPALVQLVVVGGLSIAAWAGWLRVRDPEGWQGLLGVLGLAR